MEDFLKQTFTSKKQSILAPYYGGRSFSLDDIPFDQLEEICALKPSCEPADEYRAAALDAARNFAHKSN